MSEKKGLFGGLFGKKEKKGCCDFEIVEETEACCDGKENCCSDGGAEVSSCGCENGCCPPDDNNVGGDKYLIRVLGTGCAKCKQLEENAKLATADDSKYRVEKVTDIVEIARLGAMVTPALMVGDKIVSSGKVLSSDDIKEILTKA